MTLSVAQATQLIIQAGLVPVVEYAPDPTTPAGQIVPGSQSPAAGTMVVPGTQQALVSFVVSQGPPQGLGTVTVPNLVGKFVQAAYDALAAASLSVDRLTWVINAAKEATVVSQLPAAGASVQASTIVRLTVSLGPAAPSSAVATPAVS